MDGIARGILGAFGIKSNAEPPKPKTPLWYQAHVSGKGWMDAVNGGTAGTVGQNRALEAIKIDMRKLDFKIKARAHIQNIGLKDFGYIKTRYRHRDDRKRSAFRSNRIDCRGAERKETAD